MQDVKGRVAVVTGASRGLGEGMAARFLERGLRLGLCARTEPTLQGTDVMTKSLDVTDGPAVHAFAREVADRFGPIDLWINNAGVLDPVAPLRRVAPEAFQRNLDINVMGVFHGTQAYVQHREQGGVLINISSGAARNGYPGWSAYCAAKAAVDLLTEAVQLEEASTGLKAYALAPGVIDTDMQRTIRGTSKEDFPLVDKFLELKEQNAFATPVDVADKILTLSFETPVDSVRLDLRD